tara:strand:- start:2334 stop:2549 length:216 start_codon:yes stop_codon:yes gene_type:complete
MDTYTKTEIISLNCTKRWYGSIKEPKQNKTTNKKYKLYATGDADTFNGRKYIALPANKLLTEKDKKKYNIW